jgi:predicted nucleotidyltransferase
MSQKDYNIGIVEQLLRSDNHIRGLAKALDTNQTTISRKIYGLYKENIVDFRIEGKNKVFFLKKTLESKQYAYMAEMHRLLSAIKTYPQLRRIIEEIKKKDVKMAVLFGSYAKSAANKGSDIDIYVETQDENLKQQIEQIDTRISVKIGKYDPLNLLIREIEKNHIILKGVEEYYEKNQFFS